MEELISLRNFGCLLGKLGTPGFLFIWSDDGNTVCSDNRSITMDSFR